MTKKAKTVVAKTPRWRKNEFGAVSCYVRGIGLHIDITFENWSCLFFGWEVELGDAYEYGRAATLEMAKDLAIGSAKAMLQKTLRSLESIQEK